MHRQLGHIGRWQNPPVYRPLVDLLTMEERHVIVTYRFDRATIRELCTQLESDLMSPIRLEYPLTCRCCQCSIS
ncbi:hypothetical protein NDU88_006681 [Pleurodeles waltl]|uniref:Uncharacterized protein n=1 Tax=Pleurodeles waltl TaxID=8319 RepID=A0AAV7WYY3_PLEWA|nr:hypothetical protein NDU88_006681 [Pleurodeles waltl]